MKKQPDLPADLAKSTRQLSDNLLEHCMLFATNGGFPEHVHYHQSQAATISAVVLALANVVAGTLGDPEEVIEMIVEQIQSKHVRELIAIKRKSFFEMLLKDGKAVRHAKPK